MYYSNGLAFIPIHKNASTWLRNTLNLVLGGAIQIGVDAKYNGPLWKASTYKARSAIAFVRNPWDRTLSGYLYDKKNWKPDQVESHGPFPEFEEYLKEIDEHGIGNVRWQSFKRQVDYVDVAIKDLFFLGRFESLYDDFGELCKKMSIETPDEKKYWEHFRLHGNRSRGKTGGPLGYKEYYDKKTRKLVEKIYGADIKKFQYEF
jgi:hypothetical protein